MRTDNQELTKKDIGGQQMYAKGIIDTSKGIKPQHLNKSKLHLNKNGVRILSDPWNPN